MSTKPTRSCLTSYHALFKRSAPGLPAILHIEIPLIQRDYAQGREGTAVQRIRDGFLNALCDALTKGPAICLDFVYGDVTQGTLHLLDGQQRLTTLFLLHWYLACRTGCLDQESGWKAFTYATRPSARLFCERLVKHPFPVGTAKLAEWIEDQAWYLQTWQHDPTIQSMRVMLDAIHARFEKVDAIGAWERLTDESAPAVNFHLLPIEQMGLSEELYIKMNSRGKPLTAFENFKARFEQVIEQSYPERAKEFGLRVDGPWADVLWPLRGDDHFVDDEFLRYFHFVTEICQWREGKEGVLAVTEIGPLAERIFGQENPSGKEHLDFLFKAFDIWTGLDIPAEFERWFAAQPAPLESSETEKVVLFDTEGGSFDLFARCCAEYGKISTANTRLFGWGSIHLFYAVVLHHIHQTADFPRRLRVLRNLIEASADQLRLDNMPELIADVYHLVVDGTLEGVKTFNQAQADDERKKAVFLAATPTLERPLFQLEDHRLLRGRIFAFELEAGVFSRQAETFHRVFAPDTNWLALTGALLAVGDYSRAQSNGRFFQFGPANTNEVPWRALFADGSRPALAGTREVLGRFLDEVAAGEWPAVMEQLRTRWLAECEREQTFDWRYYFVKYPAMREGASGIYAGRDGRLSYDICMLNRRRMSSYYRDPYLLAIYWQSGVGEVVQDPWFSGYETEPRRLRLVRSGTEIRCVPDGFQISARGDSIHPETIAKVGAVYGVDDGHLAIRQAERNGRLEDAQDRVEVGASLVRDLVDAGL